MFSTLFKLVAQAITDEQYSKIMKSNASDGPLFIKPERGHEDGCVNGVCAESHPGDYLQH
jgi:hypothetical protein